MTDAILDSFRHEAWANRRLLEFCQRLSDDQLASSQPGGYGAIQPTLQHISGSQAFFRYLLTGDFPDWGWQDDQLASLERMQGWAEDMAAFWEDLLSRPVEADALIVRSMGQEGVREARAGVVLAQALHHGNAHREQVSAALTALGVEPPDISAWAYGQHAGRDKITPA